MLTTQSERALHECGACYAVRDYTDPRLLAELGLPIESSPLPQRSTPPADAAASIAPGDETDYCHDEVETPPERDSYGEEIMNPIAASSCAAGRIPASAAAAAANTTTSGGASRPSTATATILVGIASYRDSECAHTVDALYATAAHPERVSVAILNQAAPEDEPCLSAFVRSSSAGGKTAGASRGAALVRRQWKAGYVRVYSMHCADAKGPCWAVSLIFTHACSDDRHT